MTKQELINTAAQLQPPPSAATQEYQNKVEQLAACINSRMSARADLDRLIGAGNLEMMHNNHRNHARFIASLLAAYDPQVLVETILWVFRAYRAHGFQQTYWPAQLDTWIEVLREELSEPAFSAIYPFYQWMLQHQPQLVQLSEAADSLPVAEH